MRTRLVCSISLFLQHLSLSIKSSTSYLLTIHATASALADAVGILQCRRSNFPSSSLLPAFLTLRISRLSALQLKTPKARIVALGVPLSLSFMLPFSSLHAYSLSTVRYPRVMIPTDLRSLAAFLLVFMVYVDCTQYIFLSRMVSFTSHSVRFSSSFAVILAHSVTVGHSCGHLSPQSSSRMSIRTRVYMYVYMAGFLVSMILLLE